MRGNAGGNTRGNVLMTIHKYNSIEDITQQHYEVIHAFSQLCCINRLYLTSDIKTFLYSIVVG